MFTNGDNGTTHFFRKDIDAILHQAERNLESVSLAVIGTGLLGMAALEHLFELGYTDNQIQVITRHSANVRKFFCHDQMKVYAATTDIDTHVNVIIICTLCRCRRWSCRLF